MSHDDIELIAIRRALHAILDVVRDIYTAVRPRLSATLTLHHHRLNIHGGMHHMATINLGQSATAVWQEFSGPNGTGDKLPPAGPVTFSSSDPAVATVDPNSGVVMGVGAGSATISGTDSANALTASDTVAVVVPPAQSATLTIVPN